MPSTPYLVYGKVYTSRGTVPNSIVKINNAILTSTDAEGKYVLDLANMDDGYTSGESYTIESWDVYNNEYVSDTITVTGEGQEKDLYLAKRDVSIASANGYLQPVSIRSLGNKEMSWNNPLTVSNMERKFTQKIAYDSSIQPRPEYVGEAAPGTPSSQLRWRISRLTYSSAGTTDVQWANGNTEFDKSWDSRTSYAYS